MRLIFADDTPQWRAGPRFVAARVDFDVVPDISPFSPVAAVTAEIQAKARGGSEDHGRDRDFVASLFAAGQLDEGRLFAFASEGAFDRTLSALSLMCDLPLGLIERCLVQKRTQQILVLAKTIELRWETVVALIIMQAGGGGISRSQLDQCFTTFSRLQKKTAQTALHLSHARNGAGMKAFRAQRQARLVRRKYRKDPAIGQLQIEKAV
jgi:hypothetical protein